jgi:tRNA U34 5-carboxymethylaminomethyl modifying enzyme MnmG/GidA
MTTKATIYHQHSENQDWLKRLDFYKEEIIILKERLDEVTTKNNASDFLKDVEHFQNQFIVQRNNIDELGHSIKMNEQRLVNEVNANPVAVDHRKVENHETEADFIGYFEKNFAEFRTEYNKFLSKWM